MMGGSCRSSWTAAAEKKTQGMRDRTAGEDAGRRGCEGQRCEKETVDVVYAEDRLLMGRRFAVVQFGLVAFLDVEAFECLYLYLGRWYSFCRWPGASVRWGKPRLETAACNLEPATVTSLR